MRGHNNPVWTALLGGLSCLFVCGCDDSSPRTQPTQPPSRRQPTAQELLKKLVAVYPATPHRTDVYATEAKATNNGRMVALAIYDFVRPNDAHRIELWDMWRGEIVRTLPAQEPVIEIAISPTNQWMATIQAGWHHPIRLWQLPSGRASDVLPSLYPPAEFMTPATFTRQPWPLAANQARPMSGFGYTGLAFNADGVQLAAGCADGTVVIWDMSSRKPLQQLSTQAGRVVSLAFSPDGTRLLVAGDRDQIELWDLAQCRPIRTYNEWLDGRWPHGHRAEVAFSPNSKKFAFYAPATDAIRVCQSEDGQELLRVEEDSLFRGGVPRLTIQRSLRFLSDDKLYSHTESIAKTWNVESGDLLYRKKLPSALHPNMPYPRIQAVDYLSQIDAFLVVELANNQDTEHRDATFISYWPASSLRTAP